MRDEDLEIITSVYDCDSVEIDLSNIEGSITESAIQAWRSTARGQWLLERAAAALEWRLSDPSIWTLEIRVPLRRRDATQYYLKWS